MCSNKKRILWKFSCNCFIYIRKTFQNKSEIVFTKQLVRSFFTCMTSPKKVDLFHVPTMLHRVLADSVLNLWRIVVDQVTDDPVGREPWSSGYGRRLVFKRLWVQIPALYTGWKFFHIYLL